MASRHRWARVAGLIAITASSAARAAGPSAEEKETARAMMDEGHARRAAGDHAAALQRFRGADAIMHVPTTGLELAREQVALGLLVQARDTLHGLLSKPPDEREPEVFRAAREAAQILDREVAAHIPSLKITLTGGADPETVDVAIDAVQVPSAALVSPFKLNPGHHVVTAATSGGATRQEVDVAPSQETAITLIVAPAMNLKEPQPPVASTPPRVESRAPATAALVPWLRWGGFGLGAVAVAVGGIEGLRSTSLTNTAKTECTGNMCPPSTWSGIDSAHSAAVISNIAFTLGGVGAAVGLISFAFGASSPSAKQKAGNAPPWVSLQIGVGMVGVGGTL